MTAAILIGLGLLAISFFAESGAAVADPPGTSADPVGDMYDHDPSAGESDDEGAEAPADDTKPAGAADESAEADEGTEAPDTSPAGRGFDENLLGLAEQFGLSRETAVSYSSPSDLLRTLSAIDARDRAVAAAAAAARKGDEAKPKPAPVPRFDLKALGLNAEELPEGVVEAFGKVGELFNVLRDHYEARTEEFQGVLGHLHGQFAEQAVRAAEAEAIAFADRFDALNAELGPDWEADLGKEKWRQLDQKSPTFQKRTELINWMREFRGMYVRQGKPAPTERELHKMALRQVFPDKLQAVTRTKIAEGLKKNSSQITRKPVSRSTTNTDGRDKAARTVEKWQHAHGINVPGGGGIDEDREV